MLALPSVSSTPKTTVETNGYYEFLKFNDDETITFDELITYCNRNRVDARLQWLYKRTIWEIDIEPPKDLVVPFLLVSKTKNSHEAQSLQTKFNYHINGPELEEAILLGYRILKIHKIISFHILCDIFSDYVVEGYRRKRDGKEPVIIQTSKNFLNFLTGKFGERDLPPNDIFVPFVNASDFNLTNEEFKSVFAKETKKISTKAIPDFTKPLQVIFNQNGLSSGITYSPVEPQREYTKFPLQLTTFILSHSKVFMSKITREMDLYRSTTDTVNYSDTDSVIVHKSRFDKLASIKNSDGNSKYIGPELGQLKDELTGKLVRLFVLAPKTYFLIYIYYNSKNKNDPLNLTLQCKMKCKGIPHSSENYPFFDDNCYDLSPSEIEELVYDYKSFKIQGENYVYKVELKRPNPLDEKKEEKNVCFIAFKNTEELNIHPSKRDESWWSNVLFFKKRITLDMIEGVMNESLVVECIYRSFDRNMIPKQNKPVNILSRHKIRKLVSEFWWNKGVRQFQGAESMHGEIAFPVGYSFN
jgi:hypothetical protein